MYYYRFMNSCTLYYILLLPAGIFWSKIEKASPSRQTKPSTSMEPTTSRSKRTLSRPCSWGSRTRRRRWWNSVTARCWRGWGCSGWTTWRKWRRGRGAWISSQVDTGEVGREGSDNLWVGVCVYSARHWRVGDVSRPWLVYVYITRSWDVGVG